MRNIRVACIGLGSQGLRDLRELAARTTVVALCSADPDRLRRGMALCPSARPLTSLQGVLSQADIEAVSIAVPDCLHVPIALEVLRSGCHCFCQKPMASQIEGAYEMASEARKSSLATQVALQGLFHPRAARTRELLRSGVIGDLVEVHAWASSVVPPPEGDLVDLQQQRAGTWRWLPSIGTGVLGDLGSHALAMLFSAFDVQLAGPCRVQEVCGITGYHPQAGSLKIPLVTAHPFPLFWYQGGATPNEQLVHPIRMDDAGCVIVGTEGTCYLPGLMNHYVYFLPRERFCHLSPTGSAQSTDVYDNWLDGCAGSPTEAPFWGFPLRLTEAILAGTQAFLAAMGGEYLVTPTEAAVP